MRTCAVHAFEWVHTYAGCDYIINKNGGVRLSPQYSGLFPEGGLTIVRAYAHHSAVEYVRGVRGPLCLPHVSCL